MIDFDNDKKLYYSIKEVAAHFSLFFVSGRLNLRKLSRRKPPAE